MLFFEKKEKHRFYASLFVESFVLRQIFSLNEITDSFENERTTSGEFMESCSENNRCCQKLIHLLVTIAAGIAATTLIVVNIQKLSRVLRSSTKDEVK
jgi:hypothetical protein